MSPRPDDDAPTERQAARRTATDQKLASAVLALLREIGPHAVTVEAVAARSGVAKTTIYRRYQDRTELFVGVLTQISPTSDELADAVPSREGFAALLRGRQAVFEDQFGLAAVARLLAADEAIAAEWRSLIFLPRLGEAMAYFERGVAAGVLDPDVDYEIITEMIMGGMVVRDAIRGDVPDDWADDVVAVVWPLIAARREGDRA